MLGPHLGPCIGGFRAEEAGWTCLWKPQDWIHPHIGGTWKPIRIQRIMTCTLCRKIWTRFVHHRYPVKTGYTSQHFTWSKSWDFEPFFGWGAVKIGSSGDPPPTSSGSAPLLLDLHLRRHNRRKSSTKPNHFCMQLKQHFRTFGDFHSRYPYYVPSLVAGVGWDSLASIAAYHGAQATWPPLLTPSSSSSSIPQLPPPKLNNAHWHILLQQRYVARWLKMPIYWSNKVL